MNIKQALKGKNKQFILLFICITVLAMLVRLLFFQHVSRDYEVFLQEWFDEIRANGGFKAIGLSIGDYLPTYIYILAALTYLPIDSLFSIKLVSCLGDIILACYAYHIMFKMTKKRSSSLFVYAVVLFLPTVVLNGAAWGQCDTLYTGALLACVYYMLENRPTAGMVAFGIAFAFKMQAVFLAPFILMLLIKKKIRFSQLFYVPAVYLVAIIPAALAGRNILDLLTIYFRQAGSYSGLSQGAPNFYAFIDIDNPLPVGITGVCLFAVIVILAAVYIYRTPFVPTDELLLKSAFLSLIAVPFLLPYMHERYFYPADIFAVILAFCFPKRWYIPVIVQLCSLFVYSRYLYGLGHIPTAIAALPMFFVVCVTVLDVYKGIGGNRQLKKPA